MCIFFYTLNTFINHGYAFPLKALGGKYYDNYIIN
nr:MAG TPA: hypothetical protein [Caudoviricetes sp.]